jgi:hypothetical protein
MARFSSQIALPFLITVLLFSSNSTGQSDYYPLTEGARLFYQITATQKSPAQASQEQTLSAMIVHLGSAIVQGKSVVPEGRYIDGRLAGVTFIADDETGVYYFANQNGSHNKPVVMDPIQYVIKYPVQTGASWQQKSSGFEMLTGKKLHLMLKASIVSEDEIVSVPAGVFAKCLKIHMTGTIPSSNGGAEYRMDNQLWYAPGLGMIKQIQKEERISPQPVAFTMVLNLQEIKYDKF